MAIFIEGNKKIKNIFANVNGEKKSISSAWANKDGVPTKVYEKDYSDFYEIAPENAHLNWRYTLDDANSVITLNRYIGSETDVIVYANYIISGKKYKTQLVDCHEMFYSKSKIKTIKFSSNIDANKINNMAYMFGTCNSLLSVNIEIFNTYNVVDMSYMFSGCFSLENLDISNFNTSNVSNMSYMFSGCEALVNINLNNFDTHNVTNMQAMFMDCLSLENIDLSSFDTLNVSKMNYMFCRDSNLKTIYVTNGKWSTSIAETTDMFKNCGTSSVTFK